MDASAQLLKKMEREACLWLNEEVGKGTSSGRAQNPISKDGALRLTFMMPLPLTYSFCHGLISLDQGSAFSPLATKTNLGQVS